jgi:hypothetical protein
MRTLYTLLILLLSSALFAQIQGNGGLPTSTKLVLNDKIIQKWVYAQPDISVLQAQDALTDDQGTAPWRFGYNNFTNLNTTNAGSWFDLPNGGRLWILQVKCEQALTVNLTFENTNIPTGNQLFVYNPTKDFILGAFTQEHIYDGQLGTELIPGEDAIIEYYVAPKNNHGHVQLATYTIISAK